MERGNEFENTAALVVLVVSSSNDHRGQLRVSRGRGFVSSKPSRARPAFDAVDPHRRRLRGFVHRRPRVRHRRESHTNRDLGVVRHDRPVHGDGHAALRRRRRVLLRRVPVYLSDDARVRRVRRVLGKSHRLVPQHGWRGRHPGDAPDDRLDGGVGGGFFVSVALAVSRRLLLLLRRRVEIRRGVRSLLGVSDGLAREHPAGVRAVVRHGSRSVRGNVRDEFERGKCVVVADENHRRRVHRGARRRGVRRRDEHDFEKFHLLTLVRGVVDDGNDHLTDGARARARLPSHRHRRRRTTDVRTEAAREEIFAVSRRDAAKLRRRLHRGDGVGVAFAEAHPRANKTGTLLRDHLVRHHLHHGSGEPRRRGNVRHVLRRRGNVRHVLRRLARHRPRANLNRVHEKSRGRRFAHDAIVAEDGGAGGARASDVRRDDRHASVVRVRVRVHIRAYGLPLESFERARRGDIRRRGESRASELDEVKRRRCPDLGGYGRESPRARREAETGRGVVERGARDAARGRRGVLVFVVGGGGWGGNMRGSGISPRDRDGQSAGVERAGEGVGVRSAEGRKRTRDDGRVVIVDARGGRVGGVVVVDAAQSLAREVPEFVVARRVAERDDARESSLIRRPRVRGLVHERETTLDVARAEGNRGVERHARGGGRLGASRRLGAQHAEGVPNRRAIPANTHPLVSRYDARAEREDRSDERRRHHPMRAM